MWLWSARSSMEGLRVISRKSREKSRWHWGKSAVQMLQKLLGKVRANEELIYFPVMFGHGFCQNTLGRVVGQARWTTQKLETDPSCGRWWLGYSRPWHLRAQGAGLWLQDHGVWSIAQVEMKGKARWGWKRAGAWSLTVLILTPFDRHANWS